MQELNRQPYFLFALLILVLFNNLFCENVEIRFLIKIVAFIKT